MWLFTFMLLLLQLTTSQLVGCCLPLPSSPLPVGSILLPYLTYPTRSDNVVVSPCLLYPMPLTIAGSSTFKGSFVLYRQEGALYLHLLLHPLKRPLTLGREWTPYPGSHSATRALFAEAGCTTWRWGWHLGGTGYERHIPPLTPLYVYYFFCHTLHFNFDVLGSVFHFPAHTLLYSSKLFPSTQKLYAYND